MSSNLTKGPILKVLTKLALPIMASAFLSTAYNLTDMAWIGMLGSKAVAGVGVGGMYTWLSSGLALLARMGGQVHVGQALGRGDREEAKTYAKTSILLSVILGILFGVACVVFVNPLVAFFRLGDPMAIKDAKIYIQIVCGLVVFTFVSIVLTGLYTAQGDSKTPLKANLVGLVLNMILDPLLILGVGPFPRLEVVGAAVATVLAQMVVTIVMIGMLLSKHTKGNIIREIGFRGIPSRKYFDRVIRLGGPSALQSMLYCMFSMVISRMVSAFGYGPVAVQRVGGQIESLSWNTSDGFSSAINAFTAQNYGAGEMERVKKGYRISAIIMLLWGGLITAMFLIFPRQISEIFFHESDVIAQSVDYLRIIGVSEAFMCVEIMAIGAISGMGNTKVCSIISIILTGLRIPLAFLLSRTTLALNGIWWALTFSSVAKGLVLNGTFHKECSKNANSIS